jgi:hypothetical protein
MNMTKEKDEWGNIELPGLSDSELYNKNWNLVAAAQERYNDLEFRKKHKEAVQKVTSSKKWQEEQKERNKLHGAKIRGKPGSNKGIKWSEEIKQKQSIAAKNRSAISEDTKQKMSQSGRYKGKKLTLEEVIDIRYNLRAKDAIIKYPDISETTITRIRTNKIWKDK